jgi:hypothetical protein
MPPFQKVTVPDGAARPGPFTVALSVNVLPNGTLYEDETSVVVMVEMMRSVVTPDPQGA